MYQVTGAETLLPSGRTEPLNVGCRVDILVILMHWTQLPPRISEPQDMVGKVGGCAYRFPIRIAWTKRNLDEFAIRASAQIRCLSCEFIFHENDNVTGSRSYLGLPLQLNSQWQYGQNPQEQMQWRYVMTDWLTDLLSERQTDWLSACLTARRTN